MKRGQSLIGIGMILWLVVTTVLNFAFPSPSMTELHAEYSERGMFEIMSFLEFITISKTISGLVGIGLIIIGIILALQESGKLQSSYFSVKSELVSVKRQTIFALIPGLDLYAAFKVKKATNYILIITGLGIPAGFLLSPFFNVPYNYLLTECVVLPIAIILIRRWSKEWNTHFSSVDIEK